VITLGRGEGLRKMDISVGFEVAIGSGDRIERPVPTASWWLFVQVISAAGAQLWAPEHIAVSCVRKYLAARTLDGF